MAGHVGRLLADLARRTDHHVLDLGRVQRRVAREQGVDAVRDELVGAGQVESAAVGLGKSGADVVDDDDLAHQMFLSFTGAAPAITGMCDDAASSSGTGRTGRGP